MWVLPGFEVYWRAPGESQIGLDHRCATKLSQLSAAEQHLLERLPAATEVTELRARGRELGITVARMRVLLQALRAAGYLVSDMDERTHPAGHDDPDVRYWNRAAVAGHAFPATRAQAVVALESIGALGLRIGCILAQAGVGTLVLLDDGEVRPHDVGVGTYRPTDVGHRRTQAALPILRAAHPKVRTWLRPQRHPDLTILTQFGVVDPVLYREHMRNDALHLPVLVGDLDVVIGPLVSPGTGPCLRCLDLHRHDLDGRWSAVAAQAAGRPEFGVESSLEWTAAGIAATQALAVIDGRESAVLGRTVECSAWDPMPRQQQWAPHDQCGCAPATLTAQVR